MTTAVPPTPAVTTTTAAATTTLTTPADPASSVAPLLSVESLTVDFADLVAVDDVSFALDGGMLLGLVGPNGAGKTTLLRALAGIQPVSRGTVRVLGERVDTGGTGEALARIGFTPDTPPVYEDLTVRQFLRFIGMGYGLGRGETDERIDFWLERVWLAGKADQRIKQLSRGMRQRIGIARTLLPNPALVLLDEPAAGLDPAGRVQFRELLVSLREQGKGLIVSSHILSDMAEYCTHIAMMTSGRMMTLGTVAEIAGHGSGARCRYTIRLARAVSRLQDVLAGIDVNDVQADGHHATFEFHSDRDQAAGLLAELVRRGLPVASFTPHAPGLEEAYLRSGIRQVD